MLAKTRAKTQAWAEGTWLQAKSVRRGLYLGKEDVELSAMIQIKRLPCSWAPGNDLIWKLLDPVAGGAYLKPSATAGKMESAANAIANMASQRSGR